MDKIGYGVIGLGVFGEKHAGVLSTMPNVKLSGVCRWSPEPFGGNCCQYFVHSILQDKRPTIITPEKSLTAVEACLTAEESAPIKLSPSDIFLTKIKRKDKISW